MEILQFLAMIAIMLASIVSWINIDLQSFTDWGWQVLALIGFSLPIIFWGITKK